jgi:hypothetical protein
MGRVDVQEDAMSFEIKPPDPIGASNAPLQDAAATQRAEPGRFSRVYELEEARRRRADDLRPIAGDRIPADVWDEVDRAAELVETMQADGRRVMFDQDRLTGRVVASLLGPDGSISPVSLSDAVDPGALAAQIEDGGAQASGGGLA